MGSPRTKASVPPVEPPVQHKVDLVKSAEKTKDIVVGSTYADQMARARSRISSDHAPPKPVGVVSPKTYPAKSAASPSQRLDDSRYAPIENKFMIVGQRNHLRFNLQPK